MLDVRPPGPDDLAPMRAVATACDQTGPLSVCEPLYVDHVSGHGRIRVAGEPGTVVGYAGVLESEHASYLTDLFVHPGSRSAGVGSALLAAMWDGRPNRVTTASQDPRALSSYARFGARPRWPLLYLRVPGTPSAPSAAGDAPYQPGDAGWWVALDGLRTWTADGAVAAVRVAAGRRQILRASTQRPLALLDVVAALRGEVGPDGSVSLVLPGPHPALPALLEQGARVGDIDLWCAVDPLAGLVDPEHELPNAALG